METGGPGAGFYANLPPYVLKDAAVLGVKEPEMSAREYVETFVKDVMEAGGHGQVDKDYDRKLRSKVLSLDNPSTAKPKIKKQRTVQTLGARELRRIRQTVPERPCNKYARA